VIGYSVFTHLIEDQARFYLHEFARILQPGGVIVSTWFLFDKREFPMMQGFQNALYINLDMPANAVIFDRAWLCNTAAEAGLTITEVVAPAIRGFHWLVVMRLTGDGVVAAQWPPDAAPPGDGRPPLLAKDSERIGLK
jgi:hypothetical protein